MNTEKELHRNRERNAEEAGVGASIRKTRACNNVLHIHDTLNVTKI